MMTFMNKLRLAYDGTGLPFWLRLVSRYTSLPFQTYIQPPAIAKARIAAGISSYSTFSQNLVKAPLSPITGLLG